MLTDIFAVIRILHRIDVGINPPGNVRHPNASAYILLNAFNRSRYSAGWGMSRWLQVIFAKLPTGNPPVIALLGRLGAIGDEFKKATKEMKEGETLLGALESVERELTSLHFDFDLWSSVKRRW